MTKEQKEWLKLCKILGLNGVELQFFLSLFYLPVEPKEKGGKKCQYQLTG